MSKKMRESLSEEQKNQRDEVLHLLNLNLSLCHLKRKNFKEAIKSAKESIEHNKQNPKAYYRLAMALKANSEFEDAKLALVEAIKLDPSNKNLRDEYKSLGDLKMTKEKEWYSKMNGFYNSKKMSELERKEQEEAILREKLIKKHFNEQE